MYFINSKCCLRFSPLSLLFQSFRIFSWVISFYLPCPALLSRASPSYRSPTLLRVNFQCFCLRTNSIALANRLFINYPITTRCPLWFLVLALTTAALSSVGSVVYSSLLSHSGLICFLLPILGCVNGSYYFSSSYSTIIDWHVLLYIYKYFLNENLKRGSRQLCLVYHVEEKVWQNLTKQD